MESGLWLLMKSELIFSSLLPIRHLYLTLLIFVKTGSLDVIPSLPFCFGGFILHAQILILIMSLDRVLNTQNKGE